MPSVYAKRPFNGPESVIEYLGRYTHKIAISNHRIREISEGKVCFSYKDYRQNGKSKEMTLDALEFFRRFALHILPKGFVRIRHYGILSSTVKAKCIIQIKDQLPELISLKPARPLPELYNPKQCPCCKKDTMLTLLHFNHGGPSNDWQHLAKRILVNLN